MNKIKVTKKSKTYLIVYKNTMIEPSWAKRYTRRHAAENSARAYNARHKCDDAVVFEQAEYARAIEGKGEWKRSANGGAKVWVPMGTPLCCDPSSETYWSM